MDALSIDLLVKNKVETRLLDCFGIYSYQVGPTIITPELKCDVIMSFRNNSPSNQT